MSKVITYKNDKFRCFCQLQLDSKERILISIAGTPAPSIKISKLGLGGLIPTKTIWEFTPTMAGGYDAYVGKMINMFIDKKNENIKHPLDAIRDHLLPCRSIEEVLNVLLKAERKAIIEFAENIDKERNEFKDKIVDEIEDMTEDEMWSIISDYAASLEAKGKQAGPYVSELLLPHPREKIIQALKKALLTVENEKMLENIEAGYLLLAEFIPEPDGSVAMTVYQQFKDINMKISDESLPKEEVEKLIFNSDNVFEQMKRLAEIVSEASSKLVCEIESIKKERKNRS